MKERLVVFYFVLLCAISVGDAALCFSNQDCPNNDSVCVMNCSVVAVEDFNQPASQGNCQFSFTSRGALVQGCFINDCNTSYPETCVPETTANGTGAACCCTVDQCNDDFHSPPEDNTTAPPSIAIQVYSVCMYNSILLQPSLVLM